MKINFELFDFISSMEDLENVQNISLLISVSLFSFILGLLLPLRIEWTWIFLPIVTIIPYLWIYLIKELTKKY